MSADSYLDRDIVKTDIVYFVPPADGSEPWQSANVDPDTGTRLSNFNTQPYEVEIENIRGREDTVSLNSTGFQYAKAEAKHESFTNEDEIRREYYPESEELIKRLTGASRVVFFDHTIRRHFPGGVDAGPSVRQPVNLAHVDQTRASAVARVHRHLPEVDKPKLLSGRFQIINLWRPIGHPALDHPLALCDYRSVVPGSDLVPTKLKYADYEGETLNVKYSPSHKWKYVRGMTPDEVVLIKCYDSVEDGSAAILTPHTAFTDPTTPPDAPLRESIELRALVFHD